VSRRKGSDLFLGVTEELFALGVRDFHALWAGHPVDDLAAPLFLAKERSPARCHISFLGQVLEPNLLMAPGDIFLLTSREDPFPLVSLEAAERGLPTLCFPGCGGMEAFVRAGGGLVSTGREPKDMARLALPLLENPAHAVLLGQEAQKLVLARHTMDSAGPAFVALFERLDSGADGCVALVTSPRLIAFHLPQFHAIPENDEWWGKGFTEWTNVTKAQPLFDGHYQPHVPTDLGYYDLSKPSALKAQAALAQEYGIHGFCYYHYWFNGKLLLETPLHQMLKSGEPDFPFCLCWANEDWTRAWDGRSGEVLVGQKYSDADDIRHLHYLLNFFEDTRYIRIDDRPLFLVYRANRMPDARRTTDTWRSVARKLGIGELYLCRVESFPDEHSDPTLLGFDAAIEFQPDWQRLPSELKTPAFGSHRVYDYATVVGDMIQKPPAAYKRFPCVVPSWDNSPRRKTDAVIFLDSSPTLYKRWLQHAIKTTQKLPAAEQLVFINAWNEWGEGNHLEPDQKFGTSYLEATRSVLQPDNDAPAAVLLSFETLDEFEKSAADFSLLCEQRIAVERSFITSGFPLNIRGRCYVCDTDVEYSIDSKGAYQMPWGEMPHWRERAICPRCGLNGRMRSFVQLLEQLVSPKSDAAIYISEQMTELYRVLLGRYPHLIGSEYREGLVSGQVGQDGIRNESLTNLSFASESFDVVLSTDVFEHVYAIDVALRECLRVLRPGGSLLFTVPFSAERKENVLRARQHKDGTIEHILPASYHGDPVRAEGSLTFHQFGWQLLDQIKDAGFSEVTAYNVWEPENIYLGPYNWFFKAMKPINKSMSLATSGRNLCGSKVSIIIPVFNKVEYTKQCIHAIIRNTPAQLFDIIIIDNASTDDTKSYLQGLSGDVRIITNEQNVGYTIACNQGAAVAQGKYLVLLNNDTVPQPGWLESLIKLAEERPDAGAIGAKLVYPNGILQEAGGIVFQDGSGWNFGNGDDPNKPVYNVVSDVDYCSGACLLVKKELFDQVGGFDEQYAPAYYEETDLCFSLREKGYKTLYNPDVLVIHHESVTAGLDLKSSFRKYIEINRIKFSNKWCNDLKNMKYTHRFLAYLHLLLTGRG